MFLSTQHGMAADHLRLAAALLAVAARPAPVVLRLAVAVLSRHAKIPKEIRFVAPMVAMRPNPTVAP